MSPFGCLEVGACKIYVKKCSLFEASGRAAVAFKGTSPSTRPESRHPHRPLDVSRP